MPLFDQIVRIETRARRQNESDFEYLNTSARPGITAMRDLLENWFERVPDAAKADIRGRFRNHSEVQHKSAFYELFWHELLRSCGYDVEIHPVLDGVATNPDFLALQDGVPQFYLEATLAMPPGDPGADRRLAELHDTLDRMDSPDFFLEIQYRGSPEGNIRGRALRERLERWLRQLDFDEISRLYQEGSYESIPGFTWAEQGLSLTFTPMPKDPEVRGQAGARAVGVVMPMAGRMVRTHDDIRAAIEGKAAKYGALELPLVVAVNVMDDFCDDIDISNALFGEERVVAVRQPDGQCRDERGTRIPNGAWRGRAGPRNTLVSAVVITHQLSPSTLRVCAVEVIHNPWAAHPLPPGSLPFPQRSVSLPDGQVHRRPGTIAADLLDIPQLWPVRMRNEEEFGDIILYAPLEIQVCYLRLPTP